MIDEKADTATIDSVETLVFGAASAPALIELSFGELGFPINLNNKSNFGTLELPFYAKFAYENGYTIKVPLTADYYEGGAIALMAGKEIIPGLIRTYPFKIIKHETLPIEIALQEDNKNLEQEITALDSKGKSSFKKKILIFKNKKTNDEIFEKILSVLNDQTSDKLGKTTFKDIKENVQSTTINYILNS